MENGGIIILLLGALLPVISTGLFGIRNREKFWCCGGSELSKLPSGFAIRLILRKTLANASDNMIQ